MTLSEFKIGEQKKAPLLSVIVASLNQVKYLTDFIEGWKSQTFQDFEIIVIDSFSTDGSIEILSSYDKVKLINKKCSSSEAYLFALTCAVGKYLMIGTTSDFLCSRRWAERAIESLESDDELSMVWSSGIHVDQDGIFESIYAQSYLIKPPPIKNNYLPYWAFNPYVPELCYCVVTTVYRECLSVFLEPKILPVNFLPNFCYEFTSRGYMQAYISDVVFAGRTHPGQLREVNYVGDDSSSCSVRKIQKQFLARLFFSNQFFWFKNRYGENKYFVNNLDKIRIFCKILELYFLKWFVRIPRAISNRIY